jgi:hypothetical protein
MEDAMTQNETHLFETVDPAALTAIEGGAIWDPSCPSYPRDEDPVFAAFGVPGPVGPIC